MIDNLTIAMAIVAIILCAIVAWLYLKKPYKQIKKNQKKQEHIPFFHNDMQSYRGADKKTISKPVKPFHPELLTDYKTSARGGTTFKGNAKTPEEIRNDQRKNDWNN